MDDNEIADRVSHGEFLIALGWSTMRVADAKQLLREEPYYADCSIRDKLEEVNLAHRYLVKARRKLALAMEILDDIKGE